MQLSIIVLTCSQPEVTLRLFNAIDPLIRGKALSLEPWEVVMIDNGSDDASYPAISALTSGWGNMFTLISSPENVGVARGRNLGLQKCKGEYILILDNDTIPSAEAIEGLISHMKQSPECGLAAPSLIAPDGTLQNSAKPFPGILQKIRHLFSSKTSPSEREAMQALHPFYLIGACQMISRNSLSHVGMLDPEIFFGPEDADFCIRMRKAGFTVDYLPSLSIIHDWQRSSRKRPFSRQSRLHAKALLYFYFKHKRFL
ncbi:MAG: glycosyltransferase family 2 protein [Muribaculaceae bacterium]|nr:glycosyltransferase family 2 protein [Muribaculaceae bacterium]